MKKRIISLLLVMSILASLIPAPTVVAAVPAETETQTLSKNTDYEQEQDQKTWFSDVSEDQWFYDAIQYVFEKGLFSGVSDTEFSPTGSMSRGMFVTVLGRLAKIDVEAYRYDSAFFDVDENSYYAPYVAWAATMGITAGIGQNLFAPDSMITRAQMAAFIVRFLAVSEISLPEETIVNEPADFDEIPEYARESVLKLWRVGFFQGDQSGNFNPHNQATRAEASMLSMRLDTHLDEQGYYDDSSEEDPDQEPEVTEPEPKIEEEIVDPFVIIFDSNGGSPIPYHYLFAGRPLTKLPIPYRENDIFLGWYYDTALTKPVKDTDYMIGDLRLYAKYQAITPLAESETPSFASALDQGTDFTITILAPIDMTAAEVKAGIEAKNLNEQEQTDFVTITGSNSVFVLSGTHGFVAGSTYKISLIDEKLTFQGYEPSIRNFNFTTAKAKVLNLTLNADLYYIPIEDLSNITADGLAVSELVVPLVILNENVADPNRMTEGTFEYDAVIPVGARLVVYSGISPLERDLTTDNEGSVAYITVTAVNGTIYSYEQTDAKEVLFTPDVLPVPVDADLDGNSSDLSVTLPKYVLSYGEDIYANLELDSQTTVDVGDYIAFYRGEFGMTAQDAGYAKITAVSENLEQYILVYVMVTQEELLAVMDVYNDKGISGEQMLEGADVEAIEQSVELQARESGFVDEAAELLTTLALETDSFTKLRDDYNLTDVKMRTSDGKPITPEEIKLLGGQSVEVSVNKLQATLSTRLQHFSGLSGLRLTLLVGIEIEITVSDKAMIVIEIEGTFEEEVRISLNVSGGAQWKIWGIFPYIAEYNVTANIDLYNFTGIGIHASIVTREKDDDNVWGDNETFKNISEELKKLVDAKDKYVGDGTGTVAQSLNEKYAAMLEQESDWVELFSQEIFKTEGGIDPFHILAYEISVEFVVSANMNISIGCDFWYENAKRYSYSVAVFANNVTSDTIDLVEEHYEFTFYVMGTMGLRAGIRAGIKVGLFTTALASVGFTAEAGVYARVWGYFYYRISYTASLGRSSSHAGALLFELGIYLEIKFEAQAFAGTFSYNPTLYENEWPLWSAGMRENIQNFAYQPDDAPELAMKKTIRTLRVPDSLFEMAYLDLKTGDDDTKVYDDAVNFTITMTNPAFSYLPSSNILSVNPGTAKVQQGQMILTWITAPLAFTSAPISRSIDLYWDNYNDGYSISFNTNGGNAIPIFITRLNGTVIPPSAPQKQGYVFAGWFANPALTTPYTFPATMPDTDIMIYAKWTPATDTKVTIEHYLQELNGTYTLAALENRTATTDSVFTPAPKSFVGFVTPTSQSVTIKPDGSSILRYYYTRAIYTVTFNSGVADAENVVTKLKYGASLNAPTMAASGYTFSKWDATLPSYMPAGDLTFTALWIKNNDTPYRVEHYVKTTDQQRYALAESGLQYLSGVTESVVNIAGLKRTVNGLTYRYATVLGVETTSAVITGNGKLVIKLYYDRNPYQTNYQIEGQQHLTQPYVYEETLIEPALPMKAGYSFDGWYTHADYTPEHRFSFGQASMPAASFTLYGKWVALDQKYTLRHYLMNPAGIYDLVQVDLNQIAKTDQTLILETLASDNILLEGGIRFGHGHVNQILQTSVVVPSTGSLLAELYYDRVQHSAIWQTQGGTTIGSTGYRYGQTINTPQAPTKTGYLFAGWTWQGQIAPVKQIPSDVIMGTTDFIFDAIWNPAANTVYRIEHYQESLMTGSYNLSSTDTKTGVTDSTVNATPLILVGFTTNPNHSQAKPSGTVEPQGSLVLRLYYSRNTYNVIWNLSDGVVLASSDAYTHGLTSYGTLIQQPSIEKTGYVLSAWQNYTNAMTMPAQEVSFTAVWAPATNTAYVVEHYLQKLNAADYEFIYTDSLTGTTEATATATPKTLTGFTYKADVVGSKPSGTILADGSLILKLYYSRNSYTVSFNGNGTGSSATDAVTIFYLGTVTEPAEPTRTGYTFVGWSKEATGETPWTFATDTVTQATTLYAQWQANTYEVSFDLNYVGSTVAEKINQTYDATYVLPGSTPLRTGYVFEGWYDSISGGTKVTNATIVSITASQILYAHWSEATNTPYTVKHYQQNVSGPEYTEVLADRQILTGVTNATTQASHKVYVGFTGLNLTQTVILAEGTAEVAVYYDRNTYTLTFQPENGTANLVTEGVRYGTPIVAPEAPAKIGYVFSNWGVGVSDTMPNGDKTYTAIWTAISYAVSFELNYVGAPQNTQVSQTYDHTYILPSVPSRAGYTFVGWFDTTTGGHQILASTVVVEISTHTLYAHWQANVYSVSFNANYTGSPAAESIQQTYDQSYVVPSTLPTRTGYTFLGWFTDATSGTRIDATSIVLITSTQTLYAHWQVNQYTVTFVLNNGQNNVTGTYDYNTTINNAPQPTKSGYLFEQWQPNIAIVQGDATYEAQWSQITYDITYDLKSGSMPVGSSNPVSYTIESSTFSLVAPNRTGYTFAGWTGTALSQATVSVSIPNGSIGHRSYIATWTANTYPIVLNANGGQVLGGTNMSHTYGTQTLLPDSGTTSKIGSTFEGWYEAADLSGSQVSFIAATSLWSGTRTFYAKWSLINYSLTYTALNSTTHTNPNSYTYGQSITLTNPSNRLGYNFTGWYVDGVKVTTVNTLAAKNLVVEARWSIISYSITYYLNSGINNIANPSSYTVVDAISLANPTRTGYQFDAWYSDVSLSLASKITGTAIATGSTGAKSFYAKWVPNTLMVQFNANLGSGTMTAQTLTYDTTQSLNTNTFTRTGYTFNGWSRTSSGVKAYSDGGSILNPVTEGSLTLYALWTPLSYSITYDLHGGSGSGGNPVSYNIESATITLANATHSSSGYHFVGWYTDANYTTSTTGIPSGSYGNRTFHAKWVNYGVVTVVNNGNNTFTISRSGGTDGAQVVSYRTLNGSAIGGTHFTHVQSTATIPHGQSSVTVTVTEQGITAMYGNYAATAYSNVSRVYSLEIYEVSGGATLSSTTRATRTLTTTSGYTIDSGYLNNYRQIDATYDSKRIWEDTAGYNGSVEIGLYAYVLNNGAFPAMVQSYLQATASGMKVQLSSFKATDDGWPMHRYVLFSNSTGSKYFSSNKNGYVPNLPSGTYYAMVYGLSSDNTDAYTIRSPGSLSAYGTSKTVTLWDQKWAAGQDQGDYVLFGLNDICSVTTSTYNIAAAISSMYFNNATLDAKPKDVKEPTYLGQAPMSHTSYSIGSRVTVALVYDEIIGTTSAGMTVTTNLSTTPFTLVGGVGTNVLYFEGTVTSTATSLSIVSINGSVYDLVN